MKDLDADGRIILNLTIKELCMMVWTIFKWFSIHWRAVVDSVMKCELRMNWRIVRMVGLLLVSKRTVPMNAFN